VAQVVGEDVSQSGGDFSSVVAAVTAAFGDPTRRQVYLMAREAPAGVTASEVARHFSLHPNVARHHLDKLAAGGYLEVSRTRPQTSAAGRPSKRYRAGGPPPMLEAPQKGAELLVALLGGALAMLPQAEAEEMAERVGFSYGCQLAGPMAHSNSHKSSRAALRAVADALTAHGFAAHAEAHGTSLTLTNNSCPFFDTAVRHPVVCAVDRGMVKGMLSTLNGGPASPAKWSSRAKGDDACMTSLPASR
jgi:predicted ArsR family transcriptional regulator